MYIYVYMYINVCMAEVMKTIQCAHPPHHHNGFVATCQLWTVSDGVHLLLVLEPIECSTSTKQEA